MLKKCALQGLWNLDWFRCSRMYLETSLIHSVFLSDELGRNSANYGKRKVAKFPDGKNNIYGLDVKQTLHWIRRSIKKPISLLTHTQIHEFTHKLYGELNAQTHTQSLVLPGFKHSFQLDEAYIAGVGADHEVFYLSV